MRLIPALALLAIGGAAFAETPKRGGILNFAAVAGRRPPTVT
jgi:hypothetical protein